MGESQNSHKWGRALTQPPETQGSEKDKEMTSEANGTFKNIPRIFPGLTNEEQKFTSECSRQESTVVTYTWKIPKTLLQRGSAVLILTREMNGLIVMLSKQI